MDEFVCVRMIQMNGVDLAQFQFDFDMTFSVFFMNADGAIYGRYGTRAATPKGADELVSLDGFREATEAALALHHGYPANANSLTPKKGPPPKFAKPELYPKLQKFTSIVDFQGKATGSCIHCHLIHQAKRELIRNSNLPMPDDVMYKFPMPQTVGIHLDSKKRATVSKVDSGTAADAAKLKPGDEIVSAGGQPLISVADFQWVLHHLPDAGGDVPLKVQRAGQSGDLTLKLSPGWRKKAAFNWRTSTWEMRRMALGGLVLKPKTSGDGLVVDYVGWWGAHNAAKKAGALEKDEIVEFGGVKNPKTEEEIIDHVLKTTKKGDTVSFKVRRNGREIDMSFRSQ